MRDSDGYILIDMSAADITKSTQNIPGIFDRIQKVIDTNKVVLVINFGDYSPMPAIAHKKLNYYVITTTLFIITINTNDVVLIEESGETSVDVSIVPTLLDGVKIADYSIGELEGSLYAPEQVDVINDNVTADNTTWSSDKIDDELDTKVDSSSLAAVATSGSYNDLSNTPTLAAVATSGSYNDLSNTPTLAAVATSGSYNDLSNTPTIPDDLNDLNDVTLSTPTNGQTLVYDGTKFVNQTPPSGVTTLAGLSDVDIYVPQKFHILMYNGTKWFNSINLLNFVQIISYANSATITIPANGAVNITADMLNIQTHLGYKPVAVTSIYCNSNDVVMRSFDARAQSTSSFGVARNVSNAAVNAIFNVSIMYVIDFNHL